MKIRTILSISLFSAATLAPASLKAAETERLYLLSGTFGFQIQLPATLYQVSAVLPDSPSLVRRVAESIGCVLADYDGRRLVVGYPINAPTEFAVVNMNAPSHVTKVRISYEHGVLPYGPIFLLDLPNRGEVVALTLTKLSWPGPKVFVTHLTAAPLSGSGPVTTLPFDDLKYVRVGGMAGGGLPGLEQIPVMNGSDPLAIKLGDSNGPRDWRTDLPRPPYIQPADAVKGFWLRASNDSVAVIAGEPLVLDIFNKKTKAWHRVALPFPAKRVRAFGPWIATMAEEPGWLSAESEAHRLSDEERAKFKERNRGGEKRESEVIIEYGGRQEPGVTVDRFFDGEDSVFPGKLLLLNGISGALFQWSTGQADSEIVLATDDAVYYRVNDELFRAGIRGGEMEEPVRLASGPAIFQVHWAFLGPAGK